MLSAGVAQARPQFETTELEARAGEQVHYSISGAQGHVEYELELDDREVLESEAAGNPILGEFTMPDLGDNARTLTLEAQIEQLGKTTKVKRKIRYVGPGLVAAAPTPPPAAAPAALAPAAIAPGPPAPPEAPLVPAGGAPDSNKTVARQRGKRRPRKAATGRTSKGRRAKPGVERRRRSVSAVKRTRTKHRNHPRTAPLFDGIPEAGTRARRNADRSGSVNATAPQTASPSASRSASPKDRRGALTAAVLVPGMLALATLSLAGTAVARRRRLNSRPGRLP